ncbi:MAG: hypothetical protein ACK5T5_09095 [Phenylobacterium sp.]
MTIYFIQCHRNSATLRASITNLTNAFGWRTSTSGAMTYNEPFRALLSVTADY